MADSTTRGTRFLYPLLALACLFLAGVSAPRLGPTVQAVVPTNGLQVQYSGTGSQTVFSFPYYFIANTDLSVTVGGVAQTLGTNYTVTLPATDGSGGSVTFISGAPASGATVVIVRSTPYTQTMQLRGQGTYSPSSVENGSDRLEFQIQQLYALIQAIGVGDGGGGGGCAWTSPSGRSGICMQDVILGQTIYGWSEGGVWTLSSVQPQ